MPRIDIRMVSSGLNHTPLICTTALILKVILITVDLFYGKSCVSFIKAKKA